MQKRYLCASLFLLSTSISLAREVGQTPPDCTAVIDGTPVNFDAYKGQVLLIDFWATWCPPCKQSMPFLNNLQNQRKKDGLEILAINVDEDSETARAFLQQNPIVYKTAFDPEGDCPQKFEVKAMPSSYIIDKTGKIRLVHLGFREEDEKMLTEQVSKLLAE